MNLFFALHSYFVAARTFNTKVVFLKSIKKQKKKKSVGSKMEEEEKNSIEKFKKHDKNVSPVTRITAIKIGAQRNIAF